MAVAREQPRRDSGRHHWSAETLPHPHACPTREHLQRHLFRSLPCSASQSPRNCHTSNSTACRTYAPRHPRPTRPSFTASPCTLLLTSPHPPALVHSKVGPLSASSESTNSYLPSHQARACSDTRLRATDLIPALLETFLRHQPHFACRYCWLKFGSFVSYRSQIAEGGACRSACST